VETGVVAERTDPAVEDPRRREATVDELAPIRLDQIQVASTSRAAAGDSREVASAFREGVQDLVSDLVAADAYGGPDRDLDLAGVRTVAPDEFRDPSRRDTRERSPPTRVDRRHRPRSRRPEEEGNAVGALDHQAHALLVGGQAIAGGRVALGEVEDVASVDLPHPRETAETESASESLAVPPAVLARSEIAGPRTEPVGDAILGERQALEDLDSVERLKAE
jgi:hypothetical protein